MTTTSVGTATDPAAAIAALADSAGSASTTGATGASGWQNQFLTMLVTQLQNQDPLNPMDSAQLTSQMAQISTVTGIDQLNATLKGLATSFSANQSLQATALIGHNVLVPGAGLQLQNATAQGGVNLSQAADSVVVSITDSAGQVVQTVDLGAHAAGLLNFQWDGVADNGAAAASGNYTFSVKASQAGTAVTAAALAYGLVNGVTPGAGGPMLNVSGAGQVALSAVQEVM
jgi:flagellar basal-body rod modification protein FlgD